MSAQDGKDVFQGRIDTGRAVAGQAGPFNFVDGFGPADVFRIAAGQGKFRQAQGIGPVRRRFARRDEFVCRRDRVEDFRADLEQDRIGQGFHVRPILDVRAIDQGSAFIGLAEALVDAGSIGLVIVIVRRFDVVVHIAFGRRQDAAIGCCRGDGTGIHEGDGSELAVARLGTFAVREVTRRMADAEGIIGRRIACAEAGAAESRLEDGTGFQERGDSTFADQVEVDRLRRRIDVEGEIAITAGSLFQDVGGSHDIAVVAAGTAGDDALLDLEFPVLDLIGQAVFQIFIAHAAVDGFFCFVEDIFQIGIELINNKGVAGMHGHGNHRLDRAQVDVNHTVIVGDVGRIQFLIGIAAAVLG